jgi:hypothetical protein
LPRNQATNSSGSIKTCRMVYSRSRA